MDSYLFLLNRQEGVCAICKRLQHTNDGRRFLHIDHDHSCCPGTTSCGKCIRGLLCIKCNSAIGYMEDDIMIAEAAISYLKFYNTNGAQIDNSYFDKVFCKNNHELTEENRCFTGQTYNGCRTCRKDAREKVLAEANIDV